MAGAVAMIAIVALSALIVRAMSGDTVADLVIGQADFTHNAANLIDAHGFFSAQAVAIDTSAVPNRLYVCRPQ